MHLSKVTAEDIEKVVSMSKMMGPDFWVRYLLCMQNESKFIIHLLRKIILSTSATDRYHVSKMTATCVIHVFRQYAYDHQGLVYRQSRLNNYLSLSEISGVPKQMILRGEAYLPRDTVEKIIRETKYNTMLGVYMYDEKDFVRRTLRQDETEEDFLWELRKMFD